MSDDPRTDDEQRVADAMAAFGAQVRPDPGAWDRIDSRLDGRGASASAGDRRPLLVAAAAVVLLVIAGVVVLQDRSTGDEVQVATSPEETDELAIVAVDTNGRLVELDPSGALRRVVYEPGAALGSADTPLTGPISASDRDRIVYAARPTTLPCGETADVRQLGEVVAISFDDGATTVVAPVGGEPAVSADDARVAFVTSPDHQVCSTTSTPQVVEVVDPRTGERNTFAPIDSTGSGYDSGPTGTDPPVTIGPPEVLDLAWEADGSLLVLVQPSWPSAPASVQRVTFDDALEVTAVVERPDLGSYFPTGPVTVSSVLYIEAIAPLTAGRFVVGGQVHQQLPPLPEGTFVAGSPIEVFDTSMEPHDGNRAGTSIDAELSAQALDLYPIALDDLAVDSSTGRVLVVVSGIDPSTIAPGQDELATRLEAGVPGETRLVAWDGGAVSRLGSGYRSAAWFRSSPPADPPKPLWTGVDPTVTTSEQPPATSPPHSSTVPVPGVGSERPDDAAAITDAFRSFFEQGDQSALEGSGVLEPALDEGAKTVPNGGKGVTVTIDAIIFTGDESAEVRFRLDQSGNFFTAATAGSAVFVDGRWKVSAATMCTLLSRVNIACPTAP